MAYPRKKYHTGLTYQYKCQLCHNTVRYTDKVLKFKPWYPKGFVYCPICNKPFRHYEEYAINPENGEYLNPVVAIELLSRKEEDYPRKESKHGYPEASVPPSTAQPQAPSVAKFCSECGRKFEDGEKFCPECGKIR